ncbi:MAG: UvrD-helicase domain-containing protein [Anaerorhabdus sp.]|uniref:UvrD-helicase domain-containing protein n=1 Tax=Anaerorhabdus sp. TaxID=1872524 RepID=UPI002FC814A7
MKWNNEQLLAIETTGTNVLVSASAGAGKTAVLVERLVKRCLKDHVELNEILAMTFTEAAANEMKKRLSKRLNEEYNKPDSDKAYIAKQLVYLQDAKISTIHSFCLDLIKKHADAIGLDPNFANTILEDGQLQYAKELAFNQVLNNWCYDRKEIVLTLSQYFSSRSEDFEEMKKVIFKIVQAANASSNELVWYDKAKLAYQKITTQNDIPTYLLEYFFSSCKLNLEIQIQYLNQCKKVMELSDINNEKVFTSILTNLNFMEDAKLALKDNNIDTFISSFRRSLSKPLVPFGKNIEYTSIRKDLNAHRDKCIELYPDMEVIRKDTNHMSEFACHLINFACDVSQALANTKKQFEAIHFDDMEKFAYEILLSDNHRIAKIYQQTFKEILVDEFQDTSELQNEIICHISNGYNVFRVGDVKQSIYRFRKAKPEIMRNLMVDPNTKQINLAYNYRSNHSIVSYTNDLFERLMNVDGCQDSYRDIDHVQAGTEQQRSFDSPVEFYALHPKEMDEDIDNKHAKAKFIAQKIIEMRKTTEFKQWRDYVILAKSHAEKNLLKQVFDEYNIPYSIDAKEGFYQSVCCHIVVSMLRCIVEVQDIPLVAVLTSPLYKMSDNELALLKINYKSIYTGCIKANHPIINDIKHCREIIQTDGLCACLNYIAQINHFVNEQLDAQQRTNFDLLFQKASTFQLQSNSLQQFISQIDLNIEEKSDEATALGPEEDVVRAITIHHSKGLQYKVVFYWSTSTNYYKDKQDSVLIDPDLGIGLYAFFLPYRLRRSTLQRIAIEHKGNLEDLEEAIRVLYVALTRAEVKLIIVDKVDKEINKTPITLSLLNARKGMTYLILSALSTQPNFNIYDVLSIDNQIEEKANKSQLTFHNMYPHQDSTIQTISPSSTENYFIPKLNFHDKKNRGTTIHEVIEKLPNREWNIHDFTDVELSKSDIDKCIHFSQTDLYKECIHYDIKKEYGFALLENKTLIQGSFDFIAISDNQCILIDFKSDRNIQKEDFISRYKHQIDTYNLALSKLYPQHQISSYLYSFELEEFIKIEA